MDVNVASCSSPENHELLFSLLLFDVWFVSSGGDDSTSEFEFCSFISVPFTASVVPFIKTY